MVNPIHQECPELNRNESNSNKNSRNYTSRYQSQKRSTLVLINRNTTTPAADDEMFYESLEEIRLTHHECIHHQHASSWVTSSWVTFS